MQLIHKAVAKAQQTFADQLQSTAETCGIDTYFEVCEAINNYTDIDELFNSVRLEVEQELTSAIN